MEKSLIDPAFENITENLKVIRERVSKAALASGRGEDEVRLMAVTKTIEPARINYAISQGVDLIGENRVQEFQSKIDELDMTNCKAHLIGHLQSNKAKKIVGAVDVIQSVDTVSIAKEIAKHAVNSGITQKVLLEVNIGCEWSKFGFDISEVPERAAEIAQISGIRVKGLMCVAPICDDNKKLFDIFENMHKLYIDICNKKIDNIDMEILSMGMSGDYETAILAGANLVRVGSAIFGPRIYSDKH